MTAEFLLKTMQTKRQWSKIYKADRKKNPAVQNSLPSENLFQYQGAMKTFWTYESSKNSPPAVCHYEKCFQKFQAEGNDARWKHRSKHRMKSEKALLGHSHSHYLKGRGEQLRQITDGKAQNRSSLQAIFTQALSDKPILM